MKRLMLVIMMLVILSIVGYASEQCDNVTGYGEYVLGTSSADYDFSGFTLEADYVYGVSTNLFWNDEYEFAITGGSTTTTLFIAFQKGKLQSITIGFDEMFTDFTDLDDVIDFVKSCRSTLLEKYDYDRVIRDNFGFDYELGYDNYLEGFLMIEDDEGDLIFLNWNGYDLTLGYFTGEMWDTVNESIEEEAGKGEGKL